MATTRWETVLERYCGTADAEVQLAEQRVYPADFLPDTIGFQVRARVCSHAVMCNLVGCRCKWAYTDPDVDRLAAV